MTYNWSIKKAEKIPEPLLKMAQGDSLIARLLLNRQIDNASEAKYYLDLASVLPSHSYEIPEMDQAFARVVKAVEQKQNIVIYGDYDVDGTTSVALLFRAFKMIGLHVNYYIPNRMTEGYGLNKEAIQKIRNGDFKLDEHDETKKPQTDLLISCDCGISNYDEVEFANSIGLDVIVTDHHSLPEKQPPGVANCNPKTLSPEHPLHYLPGVGVAYKLAELILESFIVDANGEPDLDMSKAYAKSLEDLVALGMIADLAPLRAENRYLVREGLKVLARTEKVGLQELMKVCGINLDPDTEHIGFGIAPRINAAGRLTDAKRAVKLMITEDRREAENLAQDLDHGNKKRQEMCNETFDDAMAMLADMDLNYEKAIAIASPDWHHGVIGIVASRLVEKFNLPVFIMAIEDGVTKGSVRGIDLPELDVFEEMNQIQSQHNIFLKYGGHKAAAGFSCKVEDTEKLQAIIRQHFREFLDGKNIRKNIKVDAALLLQEVSSDLCQRISTLSPYGIENRQPLFIVGDLSVVGHRMLGASGKHIKLFLKDAASQRPYEAVIWNRAEEFLERYGSELSPKITIVFNPKINSYRGEEFLQLDIKDWKDPAEVSSEFFARFQGQKQA